MSHFPGSYYFLVSFFILLQKQFKRPNLRQETEQGKDGLSQSIVGDTLNKTVPDVSDGLQVMSEVKNQNETSNHEEKRPSVHERLRVPVSYDDDLLGSDPKDDDLLGVDPKDDAT